MRPPSRQPSPNPPTALRSPNRRASSSLHWDPPPSVIPAPPSVIPAQAGIHATTIASTTPAPSDGPPTPQSPRLLPVAVRPADPHPLRPPPSFLRRQESMRPPSHQPRLKPSDGPPIPQSPRLLPVAVGPTPPSVIPAPPSVIPAQAGIHATTIASTTPPPSDGPPIPQSPHFLPVAVGPADPHPPLPPPRGELPKAEGGGLLHRSATIPPT